MAAVQRLRGAATILIVTHRPSHMRLADRLIVMRSGKIEMNGPSEEVLLQLSGAQL
jgi:ATP-binding cassette subfamily C protein/ATP-binding cassette subfamily C protein LapB